MDRKELMAKADELGLVYRKNIASAELESLVVEAEEKALFNKKVAEVESRTKDLPVVEDEPVVKVVETIGQKKARKRKDATRLIRCMVTSMDKDKSELNGEIFSCASSLTGFVKKMVPFNVEWHVPSIILDTIREKQMIAMKSRQTSKGTIKEPYFVPAYNIAILPPLTVDELEELKSQR